MSTSNESTILMVGLADTGKTNFLIGLDVILDKPVDPDGLCHSNRADDRSYVQPLRSKWLRGEEIGHSSRQASKPTHQLILRHPASGTRATFSIPDHYGETFDSQFVTRSMRQDFVLQLKHATGIILFLHCKDQADNELLDHPTFVEQTPIIKVSDDASDNNKWMIELACKQVKVVDILQFVAEIRETPLRVAVAISAWDLVERAPASVTPKTPSSFIAKQWPLLNQFLDSNSKTFPFRVFGVSARGGGNTPDEKKRLTELDNVSERVVIVDGDHRSNDLTRPVRWLLGMLDNMDTANA